MIVSFSIQITAEEDDSVDKEWLSRFNVRLKKMADRYMNRYTQLPGWRIRVDGSRAKDGIAENGVGHND